ncbi:TonB-dependent receptor [Alteromonas lipolytica]|uniref:TonB-dependent receptor n=1 Tax=Alteromonas lipolytica TaxID=1856405 RepID=A0A1E8FHE1_9ALTE|nr:TonB-dependent receptor [Alteromonas lipolytica]OFI35018.1 hypothetical protein BFC17_15790 [Alteromonas lipolytica]GGF55932.1 TonB-dependent receptor [Alteromonas lipolytica]
MQPQQRILLTLLACASPAALAQTEPLATLEKITVTAQFIKQEEQSTPLAITAVSGETLDTRGQTSTTDIAAQAPNVMLNPGGSYTGPALVAFIRGVGQTDSNPALEPGVGLYVDDVYYSTLTGSVFELLDLQRVEILRGPQGTLSGKNSVGGAIRLYTRRPDENRDGYVQASVGSFNASKLRGAANFTLIDDALYARLSGVLTRRDGYIDRYQFGCLFPESGFPSTSSEGNCKTGADGDTDSTALRLALRWFTTDAVEVNFAVDHTNDNSNTTPNTLLGYGPTLAPVFAENGAVWPTLVPLELLGNPQVINPADFIADDPYRTYATYADPRVGYQQPLDRTLDSTGSSLQVSWLINDDLEFLAISGYRKYESSFAGDNDASPVPVMTLYQTNNHQQYSQELRLNGTAGEGVNWTLGGFYFDSQSEVTGRVNLGYAGFDFLHGPDRVDTSNYGLFANGIMSLTDNLTASLGLRYSNDKKTYNFRRQNVDLSPIEPCTAPLGAPGNPPNCLIASLNGQQETFADKRIDYRAALSYSLNPDVLTYASVSTGYKGGGINPRPYYDVQVITFEPEELTTYEVGIKAETSDRRLRVNSAYFINDYQAIQLALNECSALFGPVYGFPCLATTNAGKADVSGIEVEFDWLPVSGLLLEGSYSYLDFAFTELNASTGLPLNSRPAYTPQSSWSLGAQYDITTTRGNLRWRLDINATDHVYAEANNTASNRIDAYTLVNASIRWVSPDEVWVVTIERRNLTDELYYLSKLDTVPSGGGTVNGSPGLPRTYTLSARYQF